ncbi:MAG TPA: hypothetical protein QGF66_04775, partial [SAR86 cluster bacterium]|nr:hypothetical protein [SAR86 cluster bacterium]
GDEIIRSINNSVAVSTTSLFAISLLTDPTQALNRDTLKKRISFYLTLVNKSDTYKDIWLTETNPEEIISKVEKLRFIKHQLIGSDTVYKPTPSEVASLSFYKNNISHIFMLYSLICESVRYVEKISKEDLYALIKMIYPIISREYFLQSPHIEKKEIDNALKTLQEEGVLASKEPESYCKPNRNNDHFDKYLALCNICEPSIKRFYITMSVLWSQNNLSKEKLQTDCDLIAKELERLEGWPYPEFSDKTKFHNFIELLIAERYVKVDKELLSASKITLKAQDSYKVFFDNRFLELIQSIN